jgi:hypothetical protein
MKQRISPDRLDTRPLHDETAHWVNQLILDLKLQLLGQQPNRPIDMTRLDEWLKHRNDLEQCKERLRFY